MADLRLPNEQLIANAIAPILFREVSTGRDYSTLEPRIVKVYFFPGTEASGQPFKPYSSQEVSARPVLGEVNARFESVRAEDRPRVLNNVFGAWARFANIQFSPTDSMDEAHIRVGVGSNAGGSSINVPGVDKPGSARPWNDVFISPVRYKPSAIAGTASAEHEWFATGRIETGDLVHEVGHAIGLAHPAQGQDDPGPLDARFNSLTFNVLTQKTRLLDGFAPTTPMIMDVVGLESIYGLRTSVNAGNDVHRLDSAGGANSLTSGFTTGKLVYDTGGAADWLAAEYLDSDGVVRVSSYSAHIDLRPAHFSRISGPDQLKSLQYNVAIWYTSQIENARGGSNDDELIGNSSQNTLEGNAGKDTLDGGGADGANDILIGGAQNATTDNEVDTYKIYAGGGNETIRDSGSNRIIEYRADGTPRNPLGNLHLFKQQASVWVDPTQGLMITQNSPVTLTNLQTSVSVIVQREDGDFVDGDFGIYRHEVPAASTTTRDILGDLVWRDFDEAEPGIQPQDDEFGNPILTATAVPGQLDDLEDSAGSDYVSSGAGDDVLTLHRGGNDHVVAGDGKDRITDAGGGDDYIEAGANGVDGSTAVGDLVSAGAGNDTVYAGSAPADLFDEFAALLDPDALGSTDRGDFINTGEGDDVALGGAERDVLMGSGGADVLISGGGDDWISGDGDYAASGFGWSVTEAANDVRVFGGVSGETVSTAEGGDAIYTGAGNDWAAGDGGDDYLDMGIGNDVAFGGSGADTLIGGEGSDRVFGDGGLASDPNFEAVLQGDDFIDLGGADDYAVGGGGADIVLGGAGMDEIFGDRDALDAEYQGADWLDGGSEVDVIVAHGGDDTLIGGTGDDALIGGDGKDTYRFARGDGADTVVDAITQGNNAHEASVLVLGAGIAREDVTFRLGSLLVDLGEGDAIEFAGFDPNDPNATPLLDSIQFDDGSVMTYADILAQGFEIDGTEGDDVIFGTGVTDRIDAKGGDDTVEAGAGDDTVITGSGSDLVDSGEGDDTVIAGDGDLLIDVSGTNHLDLTSFAGLNANNLEVTQYAGADEKTYLNFHAVNASAIGATPATGGVSVQEGELGTFATITLADALGGTVTLTHEALMTTKAGHGLVYEGRAGDESLHGTSHDDKLSGGAGNDVLAGGAGNDTYLLALNGGRDTIVEDAIAEPNATHTVLLDAGLVSAQVKALQVGENLEVKLKATSDTLVIANYFTASQSWREGWLLKDAFNNTAALASLLPVTPPDPQDWLDEQKLAYTQRREQVYAANRQAEGYAALGGNAFQKVETSYLYSQANSVSNTFVAHMQAEALADDGAQLYANAAYEANDTGSDDTDYALANPRAASLAGSRHLPGAQFGGSAPSEGQFVPTGAGGGVKVISGDVLVPVYAARSGNLQGIRDAGVAGYGAGAFENTDDWAQSGVIVYRAGTAGLARARGRFVGMQHDRSEHRRACLDGGREFSPTPIAPHRGCNGRPGKHDGHLRQAHYFEVEWRWRISEGFR